MKNKKTDHNEIIDAEILEEIMANLEPISPPTARAGVLRSKVLAQMSEKPQAQTDVVQKGLLTVRSDEGRWIKIARGVTMKNLYADKKAKTRSFLLKLEPGASLPEHEHFADEECVVLEGEVRLGDVVVRAGDYHLAPQGVAHGVVSSKTGALLFLRADTAHPVSWGAKLLKHSVMSYFS
ncbi:MAG: cupin domain-containing protein [Gammaproteobacteria bacterium]|nr:cupin domain-containing protein [Gammaproteobacteria bacterium]